MMNREQLIRICINSGVVHRAAAINLIEIIEENIKAEIKESEKQEVKKND